MYVCIYLDDLLDLASSRADDDAPGTGEGHLLPFLLLFLESVCNVSGEADLSFSLLSIFADKLKPTVIDALEAGITLTGSGFLIKASASLTVIWGGPISNVNQNYVLEKFGWCDWFNEYSPKQ